MRRFDLRVLILLPLLPLLSACGDDAETPTPTPPASAAPASVVPLPEPSDPDPVESSEYVEEDEEPSAQPGDLSDEAQALLDQALGEELTALATAPAAEAKKRQPTLDKLPESPTEALTALKGYQWFSVEAKKLYDQAVAAS